MASGSARCRSAGTGIGGRERAALICVLAAALDAGAAAQSRSLDAVLARAADYVDGFSRQLSGLVAEESCTQEVHARRPPVLQRRRLKSDLLLVRPANADRYVEFRDVFEVDGTAVRDRQERLTKLFLDPGANRDQMKAIIDESARLNIGDIPRNINTPLLPLYFLQKAQQPRFRFRRIRGSAAALTGPGAPDGGVATFRVSTEMWVVDFEEKARPTIIRTTGGRDFPAAGRFWIDPERGTVLLTELVMEGRGLRGVIDVSYESEPLLGFLVPVEMRERYTAGGARIEGVARYGRFRQFQVRTSEEIAPPPKKPPG